MIEHGQAGRAGLEQGGRKGRGNELFKGRVEGYCSWSFVRRKLQFRLVGNNAPQNLFLALGITAIFTIERVHSIESLSLLEYMHEL